MRTRNIRIARVRSKLAGLVMLAVCQLLLVGHDSISFAQTAQSKTYSSPAEACDALAQAAQAGDERELESILGAGREVTSSNDDVEDKLEREQFSQKYQEMHRLVREANGKTVLYIGAENWPFPVPLISKNGVWYFDSETGKQEILFRTIGENEAIAIEVCEEFAMAKSNDELKATSEDPITRFAEQLVAAGAAGSYNGDSSPFHGYYFRIVPNPAAASGTKKARGLILVAYPAKYRSSGVMTFAVTHHGIVREKDLGPNTTTVAPKIKFGAGPTWQPVTT
jgi:Protein of unknown function (DUF2950)